MKQINFDEVFLIWLAAEVYQIEGRDILSVAKTKGFNSISEWRLNTALKLGLDKLSWSTEFITNPNHALPEIIVGPYQGWSKFFDNQLETSFKDALEISEFFSWVKTHDRIIPITNNFPKPSSIICLRRSDGRLIHIEGGHRICAVAYAAKIGQPLNLSDSDISLAVATISDEDILKLKSLLKAGTTK